MQPMGRRHYKDKTGGKHHSRIAGKFSAWWENIIPPNKKKERQKVKNDLLKEPTND